MWPGDFSPNHPELALLALSSWYGLASVKWQIFSVKKKANKNIPLPFSFVDESGPLSEVKVDFISLVDALQFQQSGILILIP